MFGIRKHIIYIYLKKKILSFRFSHKQEIFEGTQKKDFFVFINVKE
jgi:hypothetical protein